MTEREQHEGFEAMIRRARAEQQPEQSGIRFHPPTPRGPGEDPDEWVVRIGPTRDRHVLVVGDVIDDLLVLPQGPIRPDTDTTSRIERRAGGSAANTACWLGSLGVPTTFVGTVHHDDVERHRALLERFGVEAVLHGSDLPTGTIVVLIEDGRRTMLTSRGANVETTPDLVTDELLRRATHLHLTGYSVFDGEDDEWRLLLERAGQAGLTRSFDPSSAGRLAEFGTDRLARITAGTVEVLLANRDEARALCGWDAPVLDHARALLPAHPVVVVTDGRDGAVGTDRELAAIFEASAKQVDVVEPTGAGDAFDAGFLDAWTGGSWVLGALRRGTEVAARAVCTLGGRPSTTSATSGP